MINRLLPIVLFLMLFDQVSNAQTSNTDRWAAAEQLMAEEQYAPAAKAYAALADAALRQQRYDDYLRAAIEQSSALQKADVYEEAAQTLRARLGKLPARLPSRLDSLIGLAWHKLGVSYYYLDAYPDAVAAYHRARAVRARIGRNPADFIKSTVNLGDTHYFAGQLDSAIHYLEQALTASLQQARPDQENIAKLHRALGKTYAELGDINSGRTHILAAVAAYEKLYATDDPVGLGRMYFDAARFFWMAKQGERVLGYCEQARQIFTAAADDEAMADTYNLIGIGNRMLHRWAAARTAYLTALDFYRRLPDSRQREAYIFYNLAILDNELRQPARALQNVEQANAIFAALQDTANLAGGLHARAVYLSAAGRRTESLTEFDRALKLLLPHFRPTHPHQLPPAGAIANEQRVPLANLLMDKAEALAAAGAAPADLQAALRTNRFVVDQLDLLRFDLNSDASKQFISEKARPIFERSVALCVRLGNETGQRRYLEEAFLLAERSKAFTLINALARNQSLGQNSMPRELLQQEAELRQQVTALRQQLHQNPDNDLQQELAARSFELTQVENTMRGLDPNYAAAAATSVLPTLDDLRGLLGPHHDGIIEYLVGEDQLFILYLDRTRLDVAVVPIDSSLVRLIQDFREAITQSAYAGKSLRDAEEQQRLDQRYVALARQLYRLLLDPLAVRVRLPERLLVIPDGVLGYVPFDALLTADVASVNYAGLPYLLRSHRLTYSYSAAYLVVLQGQNERARRPRILAFAPSFGAPRDEVADVVYRSGLLPLAYNVAEVERIGRLLPCDPFVRQAANLETFLSEAPHYQGLHISTHAVVDADDTDFSYIAFTQKGTDSLDATQVLYLHHLYGLHLPADLAVLSACQTSMGDIIPGEGVISLARAFAYAGTRATLTTLWNVNDRATQEIMVSFYEQLGEARGKDEALHRAQLHAVENSAYAHPYYWSGLVLYGSAEPLELNGGWSWWWLLVPVAGLLFWIINRTTKHTKITKQGLNG